MGTTLRFDRSRLDRSEIKEVTISCRGSLAMDADLIKASSDLQMRNKSDLVHDICERFLDQHFRQRGPMHSLQAVQLKRLDRMQITREYIGKIFECAQVLDEIWNEPDPATDQRRTA